MSIDQFDCTACGACCFGGHDRYIALLPEDRNRSIPPEALHEADGRQFMKMTCGHCAQLTATDRGQLVCGLYEARPTVCRAFRAGSFECLKARQHRGGQAASLRAFALVPVAAVTGVAAMAPLAGPDDGASGPATPVTP